MVFQALSSAYMPIGAVLVSPEVSDVIHSQSNKLGREKNILEQVNKIAPKFQEGLKAFSDSPIIGEVGCKISLSSKHPESTFFIRACPLAQIRGTGLILGTEFVDNKSPHDPYPPEWGVGAYFGAQCEKHGMLVRVSGDNIMMSPPFIMTLEEIDELISIYGKALQATEERVKELKSQSK
ncbi:hypothetical protein SAY86_001896 [Trapa natans]|uniref:Uncharacterized protein n=1 Tax=Trapa natans TaxID=22666 RepID=A0AAN7QZW9_TRANT|nr:hypothetical protein SAY86_001896 [Trapa natans]